MSNDLKMNGHAIAVAAADVDLRSVPREQHEYVTQQSTRITASATRAAAIDKDIRRLQRRINESPDVVKLKSLRAKRAMLEEEQRDAAQRIAGILESVMPKDGRSLGEHFADEMPDPRKQRRAVR